MEREEGEDGVNYFQIFGDSIKKHRMECKRNEKKVSRRVVAKTFFLVAWPESAGK